MEILANTIMQKKSRKKENSLFADIVIMYIEGLQISYKWN